MLGYEANNLLLSPNYYAGHIVLITELRIAFCNSISSLFGQKKKFALPFLYKYFLKSKCNLK